jgi:hypothetical protein
MLASGWTQILSEHPNILLTLPAFCCCWLFAAAAAAAVRLAAEQLYAQGLFVLFHFPIMLNTALERYM